MVDAILEIGTSFTEYSSVMAKPFADTKSGNAAGMKYYKRSDVGGIQGIHAQI